MSIDVTKANVRAIVFVKIELDGLTLRYATENVVAKDTDNIDYFWEGRVISLSTLNAGFNDFKESQTSVSSMNIGLANGKDYNSGSTLDAYVSGYFWGNKQVTVFLSPMSGSVPITLAHFGEFFRAGAQQFVGPKKRVSPTFTGSTSSTTFSTADVIFKGILSFPDVFSHYDENTLEFSVFDDRYLDQIKAAPSVFSKENYNFTLSLQMDSMRREVESKQIPIIYGDFSEIEQIPCFGINGFPQAVTRTYQIADENLVDDGQAPLHSIQSVRIAGVGISAGNTGPVTSGAVQVVVSSSPTPPTTLKNYDASTTDVYCACKGKTRGTTITALFGGSGTDLLEHPVEVLYDLLVYRLGVDSSSIDTVSFLAAYNLDTTLVCRRWVGESETVVDLINDLCFEFGYELYSLLGKFYLNVQELNGISGPSFTEDEIDLNSYRIETDPNRAYFNILSLKYNFEPYQNAYLNAANYRRDSKIAEHSREQASVLEMKWNHKEVQLVERFGWLLYVMSGPLKQITARFRSKAWNLYPTNFFNMTYHIFSSERMLTRSVGKDLNDFSTSVVAWDIGSIDVKNWALDADIDPTTYSNADSLAYAIWHADNVVTRNFNDSLSFITNATYTVTIPFGNYSTPSELASAIQSAMNAASVAKPLTVTYSSTTRKFTIATNDASNFTLRWTTTAEIGRSILGFDVGSNDSGAATYTSDYLAIFDLGGDAVSQWG